MLPKAFQANNYTAQFIQFFQFISRWVDTKIKGEVNKFTEKGRSELRVTQTWFEPFSFF